MLVLFSVLCGELAVLSACASRVTINIMSAYADIHASESRREIYAQFGVSDIMKLVEREVYSHIIVFDCDDNPNRYPIQPFLNNIITEDFEGMRKELRGKAKNATITLHGSILDSFITSLVHACAKMEGGSYSGIELTSNVIKVQRPR
jgi:hypothetical protein